MGKITSYSALATPAANDLLVIVDVDDLTMASTGTDHSITVANLLQSGVANGTATLDGTGNVPASELGNVNPFQAWQFRPESSGAKGDGKVVGDVVVNGTTTITSATASFTAADVGKHVMINGGNGTASGPLVTTIASVTNSTTAVLAGAAGTSASGCAMVWGTDDTAAINSAIANASTYAQANDWFAEVVFGAKIYMLCAAPTQTTSPAVQNAQVPIPYPAVNGQGRKLVISLKGASNAGQTQYWESVTPNLQGTCLVSTQTAPSSPSGTFGEQSVIGGPSAGGAFTGSFANVKVIVDGITVWHGMFTNQYAFDFGYVASMEWGSFSSQAFAPAANLSGATAAHPYQSDMPSVSTTIGVGCRFPLVGNNDDCAGASFAAQGIDLPLIVGDHFTCLRVATVYCDAGIRVDLVNGISSNAHAVTIGNWSCEAYNGGITCNGGGSGFCQLNITMDAETLGGADPVYDINDNGNLHGIVRIGDPGRTHRFPTILNGAPNLQVVNDMMGPGNWTGAPAAPSSGSSQQNTAWRPATVWCSASTSITSFAIDGGATITVTAGANVAVPVHVPAGHSFAVTYSGTLTTHWVLD